MIRPGRKVSVVVVACLLLVGVGTYWLLSGRGKDLIAAKAALDHRDFALAAESLEKHLDAHPDDLEARLLAARTARMCGESGLFLKHIERHKQSGGPEADRRLEYRLLVVQQGDLTSADLLLAEATDTRDTVAATTRLEALIEGTLLTLRNRSGQASRYPAGPQNPDVVRLMNATDRWLSLHLSGANHIQGLVWRGQARAAAGEYAVAIADFTTALDMDPSHFDARFQLALTIAQANPAESARHLEKLRERRPEDPAVILPLAGSYRLLGRLDEARKLLGTLLLRQPDDVRLMTDLGLVELDGNRLVEAEQHLRNALQQVPEDPVANLGMSRCMLLLGNLPEAKRYQERYEAAEIKQKVPWRVASKP